MTESMIRDGCWSVSSPEALSMLDVTNGRSNLDK